MQAKRLFIGIGTLFVIGSLSCLQAGEFGNQPMDSGDVPFYSPLEGSSIVEEVKQQVVPRPSPKPGFRSLSELSLTALSLGGRRKHVGWSPKRALRKEDTSTTIRDRCNRRVNFQSVSRELQGSNSRGIKFYKELEVMMYKWDMLYAFADISVEDNGKEKEENDQQ